jgi:FMN-dependent NADH-azoreductase
MKLLHMDSGISTESVTRSLTASIVAHVVNKHPSVQVTYRDLIANPIPYMNLKTLPSAHPVSMPIGTLSDQEHAYRDVTEQALDEFLSADVTVIGVPMYNFGVAAQLKSWFDAVVIPGKTFTYSSDGPIGLVGSKHVIAAVARGSAYGAIGFPTSMEHAEAYIRSVFSFIGIYEPQVILAEGVAFDREAALERANAGISEILPLLLSE